MQRINQTNWERTGDDDDDDGDDDEWGMSWVLKYLKDTHDSKQLQCAARIIIYMCVRVVQFKVSLDNVNIIIQLEL